jgi:hypothetical protein
MAQKCDWALAPAGIFPCSRTIGRFVRHCLKLKAPKQPDAEVVHGNSLDAPSKEKMKSDLN